MTVVVILAQIFAICVHAYLLLLERKYCGHRDWWCDTCAVILVVLTFSPILGLFVSIAGCIDVVRNITEELTKDKY